MENIKRFLSVWSAFEVSDREIVDGTVLPEHRGPSAELRQALREWPGTHYWADGKDDGRLVLIRRTAPAPKERWWMHVNLFVISFTTVWMGGALLAGADVVPHVPLLRDPPTAIQSIWHWLGQLRPDTGLWFAMTLMGILLAHEMGHYFVARRYTIDASPPFFVPAPPWYFFIGTLGAFIRLRSPVVDRRQLMDVGAAGPWAGFVVAVVALCVGLHYSEVIAEVGATEQVVVLGNMRFYLGDSILTTWLRRLIVGEGAVMLHPLAQAGWVGILVTALNLLPFGQLDGGHVVYALLRGFQKVVGLCVLCVLVILGFEFWFWWVWVGFILLAGGGRVSPPRVLDHHRPIPWTRIPLGLATALLFALTFIRVPFA